MNKKKEIMELKAEARRLKEATIFYALGDSWIDLVSVPIKDVIAMILKELCLKVSRSPEKIALKNTYETGDPHGSHHQRS